MLDLIVLVLALVCAPAMLYGVWAGNERQRGRDVPAFGEVIAAGWSHIAPAVEVVGYVVKRAIAHQWRPEEHERPRLLRRDDADYDEPKRQEAADSANRPQTDQVFALTDAIQARSLDRTRLALIEACVREGWQVGAIRSLLKGDSGTIGAEVETVRQRLGLGARTVTVSDRVDGRNTVREVKL